jgi:predicted permease
MRRLRARVLGWLFKGRRDAELQSEIDSHLDELAEEHLRHGLSPDHARAAARRDFGGVDQMKERYRDQRGLPFLDLLLQDVRYGIRSLCRDPTFSLVTVLTLALGIGAVTAIFGGVKAVLLDAVPYPQADRVVSIGELRGDGARNPGTFGMYRGLSARARSFESIAVVRSWQPTLTGAGRPERLEGQRVSARYFDVLGIHPALGRALLAEDDRLGGPNVAVLSDSLWRRRFAGDRTIVGHTVTLDDRSFVVVGVAPAGFENVLAPEAEIWTALQYDMSLGSAWGHHLQTVARLRPGVPVETAAADVNAAGKAVIEELHPETYRRDTIFTVVAFADEITRAIRPSFLAVAGAVSLMLLVACVNVTNLLLARGTRRRAEFTMRAALGASRRRLVRQLLTETLLLAFVGGAGGIAVARMGVRALAAIAPGALPRASAIALDGSVLAFAIAITTIVGLAVGLVPALDSTHATAGVREAGQYSVTQRATTRGALVVAEIAIALVLLVTTGLLLHSLQRLFAVSPGFAPSNVLTLQVQVSPRRFDKAATDRFFERALSAVREVSGVRAAAFTSQLPLSGDDDEYGARFEGEDPRTGHNMFLYAVTPGYFEAIGIPIERGRALDAGDSDAAPRVAVISESLARRGFDRENPIGRHVHIGPPSAPDYTIVGVAGDVRQMSLALAQPDAVYIVPQQSWFADRRMSLVARVGGNPGSFAPAIRDAIWSVDKDQPVLRVAAMDDLVAASGAARRFALTLFEVFALSSLTLAAIGLYGVLSGSVAERTRELAIRAALGSTRGETLSLVLRQGLVMAIAGAAIGLGASIAAGRAIATLLFGITPLDPATYVSVTAVLFAAAALASSVPAWRASRVDPAVALRQE